MTTAKINKFFLCLFFFHLSCEKIYKNVIILVDFYVFIVLKSSGFDRGMRILFDFSPVILLASLGFRLRQKQKITEDGYYRENCIEVLNPMIPRLQRDRDVSHDWIIQRTFLGEQWFSDVTFVNGYSYALGLIWEYPCSQFL